MHHDAAPMHGPASIRAEFGALLRLAGPIAFVQFGLVSLNFVDIAFLGHDDPAALPAMSLGNTLVWAATVFAMGTLAAVDPLLSQAVGARDMATVARTLLRGLALAVCLGIPAMLLLLPAPTFLAWLGQKPELIPGAATYARINTLGIVPFLWFSVLRSLLSAHARLAPQVVAIVVGNGANALLDWMLIRGNLGCPALGVSGAAWATVLCRWSMLALLVASSRETLLPHLRAFGDSMTRAAVLARAPLLRLLRLGAPIGGQFALEMGIFALTALLIGQMDADAAGDEGGGPRLGGHQIAIQLASLSFMVPLGIGLAASVRVGWAVGRGDSAAAARAALVALLTGAVVMVGFMVLFLGAPDALAGLLTDIPAIQGHAVALIPIAGVFQIGDGLQVVAIGCLRGIGSVRSPLVINAIGFWLLGLPLGCWLGFERGLGLGPKGLWWGLVAGLFFVAGALLVMVRWRFGERLARLTTE